MSASVEKLEAARALVAGPDGWTQHCMARDKSGNSIDLDSSCAVCWCARGALYCVGATLASAEYAIFRSVLFEPVIVWNDNKRRTQAEVVAAFDRAIELARAQS